jgi:hypothetical protein
MADAGSIKVMVEAECTQGLGRERIDDSLRWRQLSYGCLEPVLQSIQLTVVSVEKPEEQYRRRRQHSFFTLGAGHGR